MSTSSVTKDGRPVSEYIDEKLSEEISGVRSEATHVRVRQPIMSRTMRNHSGARTTASASYMPDPRTTKTRVGGILTDPLAKAPFTPSGFGGEGVEEINEPTDTRKCNHCGRFFKSVPAHLGVLKVDVKAYRAQHGLPKSLFPLTSSRSIEIHKEANKKWLAAGGAEIFKKGRDVLAAHRLAATSRDARKDLRNASGGITANAAAKRNLRLECRAQLTVRLLAMAGKLGRCPNVFDRKAGDSDGKITNESIKYAFEMPVAMALKSMGLNPPTVGGPRRTPDSIALKVVEMRRNGATWQAIGDAIQRTRCAASSRYKTWGARVAQAAAQ